VGDYIVAALAILFIPLFFGSFLYVAFSEKDTERVQRREEPREQGEQSERPIREVEKQPSIAPGVVGSGANRGSGHSTGNQQTGKTHHADERRMRKQRRRR